MNFCGWDFADDAKIDNALTDTVRLKELTVNDDSSLRVLSTLPDHGAGRWIAMSVETVPTDKNPAYVGQFLNNTEIQAYYPAGGNDHGLVTWEWKNGTLLYFEKNVGDNSVTGNLETIFLERGLTYTLPTRDSDPTWHRAGYNLMYWNTAADGTGDEWQLGSEYTAEYAESITFWAQWYRDAYVTMTYVLDTGEGNYPLGPDAAISTGRAHSAGADLIGSDRLIWDGTAENARRGGRHHPGPVRAPGLRAVRLGVLHASDHRGRGRRRAAGHHHRA